MDLETFPSKRKQSKKKEKKKEKKKKGEIKKRLLRETFVFNTACWLNKTGCLKGKEKRKKELFLKSHDYLFGRRLLKLCYILNAPCVEIYWLCWLSNEFCSFAHIFFSFVSLSFILAKCLIRLKNITREFGKFDYSEIYFVLT